MEAGLRLDLRKGLQRKQRPANPHIVARARPTFIQVREPRQTTMDKATFYEIARILREKITVFVVGTFEESAIDFHAKDTICGQVSGRDKKLREFAAQNDVMVFVAGRNSSNGKVLYDICREANARTHFIEEESELEDAWFRGASSVGISGATSTPQWLMEMVKRTIEGKIHVINHNHITNHRMHPALKGRGPV